MSASWAEMNVAVIHAIPNRAMADIMPALNTDWSGTDFTSGRPTKRITTPTTNMTMTIVLVMSIGTGASPSPPPEPAVATATGAPPVGAVVVVATSAWRTGAVVRSGGSSPARIFSWTSGSSSSSGPSRLTTSEVTTMPTMQAGRVIARIWVRPKLYGATSVRVSMAAIAADTGEAASATPDCTTLTDIGRDGRMPLR